MFVYSPIAKCSILTAGLLSAGLLGGCPTSNDCDNITGVTLPANSNSTDVKKCFKCLHKHTDKTQTGDKSSAKGNTKSDGATLGAKSESKSKDKTVQTVDIDKISDDFYNFLHKNKDLATFLGCGSSNASAQDAKKGDQQDAESDGVSVQGAKDAKNGQNAKHNDQDSQKKQCVHHALETLAENKVITLDQPKVDSKFFTFDPKTVQASLESALKEAGLEKATLQSLNDAVTEFLAKSGEKVTGDEEEKFRAAVEDCGGPKDWKGDAYQKMFKLWMESDGQCIPASFGQVPVSPQVCCKGSVQKTDADSKKCCLPNGATSNSNKTGDVKDCCSTYAKDGKCADKPPTPDEPGHDCAGKMPLWNGAQCCKANNKDSDDGDQCCSGSRSLGRCRPLSAGEKLPKAVAGATEASVVCEPGLIIQGHQGQEAKCCVDDGLAAETQDGDGGDKIDKSTCCSDALQPDDKMCAFQNGRTVRSTHQCKSGIALRGICRGPAFCYGQEEFQVNSSTGETTDQNEVDGKSLGPKQCCDLTTANSNLVNSIPIMKDTATATAKCSTVDERQAKSKRGCAMANQVAASGHSSDCCSLKFQMKPANLNEQPDTLEKFFEQANVYRLIQVQTKAPKGSDLKVNGLYSIAHKAEKKTEGNGGSGTLTLQKVDDDGKESGEDPISWTIKWSEPSTKWSSAGVESNPPLFHDKVCAAPPQ